MSVTNLESVFGTCAWEPVRLKTYFLNMDVIGLDSLAPFTHVYSFDIGFPLKVMRHLGKLFNMNK